VTLGSQRRSPARLLSEFGVVVYVPGTGSNSYQLLAARVVVDRVSRRTAIA
jgi:hypothetical protein